MTVEQAMAIVAQVCAEFRGTLRDHQNIQQALQVIEQALAKSGDVPKVKLEAPAPASQE